MYLFCVCVNVYVWTNTCHDAHVETRWQLERVDYRSQVSWVARLGNSHLYPLLISPGCLCLYLEMFIQISDFNFTSTCTCSVSPAQFIEEAFLQCTFLAVLSKKLGGCSYVDFHLRPLFYFTNVCICAGFVVCLGGRRKGSIFPTVPYHTPS